MSTLPTAVEDAFVASGAFPRVKVRAAASVHQAGGGGGPWGGPGYFLPCVHLQQCTSSFEHTEPVPAGGRAEGFHHPAALCVCVHYPQQQIDTKPAPYLVLAL